MASLRGRVHDPGVSLLPFLLALAAQLLTTRPAPADERMLLEETFAGKEVGSRPGPWLYFTDAGNDAVVAKAPARQAQEERAIGDRCLKLTRTGGTVWKPMVSGWAAGEPDSPIRLEFDWYLPALSDGADPVFSVTLRGDGNVNTVRVALGGPGGVAVPQGADEWVPLGFPLRAGQWGHLTIVADPISRKAGGAFDVAISQGEERAEYPNIPFRPDSRGNFPETLWYSPTFHVGGGSPEHPREAYVTNVKLTTTSPRECR
jgi:hypothetical protein